jgi:glycosyltransferase involved in cell wall biosynthesis
MRIAYIAPYQGPSLLKARPIVENLSLAGSLKIELIAGLLIAQKHQVEIISQGEVVELKCKWYPPLHESEPFHTEIPIYYAAALPIRFVNGWWSSMRTLDILKSRHQQSPYDLVIICNLKLPQTICADYAMRQLGLPVIFEYEDDAFVDLAGRSGSGVGLVDQFTGIDVSRLLTRVSGCMGASPHLLSQLPSNTPKLLLRGIVGNDILESSERTRGYKKNWVLFSGTFHKVKGIEQLIRAWQLLQIPDWELHITGQGELAGNLKQHSEGVEGLVFHGLVSRRELVRLMCSAKICVNPHDVSQTPGNVFAFKIIEYLAAGAHVISTPMGMLEEEIESGMTYMPDNDPATIAVTLKRVINGDEWKRTASPQVLSMYGLEAIPRMLETFLQDALLYHESLVKKGEL